MPLEKEKNSLKYKGYIICPGAIYKGDDVMWMFACPLSASKEDVFKQGREIIDEYDATNARRERSLWLSSPDVA